MRLKNDLLHSETLVYSTNKSLFIFVTPILLSILLYAITSFLVLSGLILIAIVFKNYINSQLIITNKRLIGNVGLFFIIETSIPLKHINKIEIEQSIIGKLFNFGHIIITVYNEEITYHDVNSPKQFCNVLNYELN